MSIQLACPFCNSQLLVAITNRYKSYGEINEVHPALFGLHFLAGSSISAPDKLIRFDCLRFDCEFFAEVLGTKDATTGYLTFQEGIWKRVIEPMFVQCEPKEKGVNGNDNGLEVILKRPDAASH